MDFIERQAFVIIFRWQFNYLVGIESSKFEKSPQNSLFDQNLWLRNGVKDVRSREDPRFWGNVKISSQWKP